MTIRCRSCRHAPAEAACWRLILAANPRHILELMNGDFDSSDCPACGSVGAITPSLVACFIVEDEMIVLDRGMDPEELARKALEPLIATLDARFAREPATDLDTFKRACFAHIKSTGRLFPYQSIEHRPDYLQHWHGLQGEVLTAMWLGARGVIPNFGVDAATPEGVAAPREETIDRIDAMIVDQLGQSAVMLPALTEDLTLEEVLTRIVDSCGAIGFVAEELLDTLAKYWIAIEENQASPFIRLHFLAFEAAVHTMITRDYPRVAAFAQLYVSARYAWHIGQLGLGKDRLRLSERRLAFTPEQVWNAVAICVNSFMRDSSNADATVRSSKMDALVKASTDLGYPEIVEEMFRRGFQVGVRPGEKEREEGEAAAPDNPTVDKISEMILGAHAAHPALSVPDFVTFASGGLRNAADLEDLYLRIAPLCKDAPDQRAALLSWFGERMKVLGEPDRALAQIGSKPAAWEDTLPPAPKRRLWTERSNALRLAGVPKEALAVAQKVLEITLADSDAPAAHRATALSNCGVLLRENGFPDAGLTMMVKAIEEDNSSWIIGQSIAATLLQMGRNEEALSFLSQVRSRAGGVEQAAVRISALLAEIAILMDLDRWTEADALVAGLPPISEVPPQGAVAYVTVIEKQVGRAGSREPFVENARALLAHLVSSRDTYLNQGNRLQASHIGLHAATLAQNFGFDDADLLWEQDFKLHIELDKLPSPRTAIEVAMRRIAEDPTTTDDYLRLIEQAIVAQSAGVAPTVASINLLAPLDAPIDRLAELVFALELEPSALLRVAEMRRNAHGKAVRLMDEPPEAGNLPFDRAARAVADDDAPPFLVVEWCDLARGLIGLVTLINAGGGTTTLITGLSDIDIVGLSRRVGARIENWRNTRQGEPFAIDGWGAFAARFTDLLTAEMPNGGHVVMIDHRSLVGIPWHIALAPRFSVSYAADWRAISAAVQANRNTTMEPSLGLLHAPRSNETDAVRSALQASADAMSDLAESKGLMLAGAGPGNADSAALLDLLRSTDVLKVLCHGQVSAEDGEVVLIIDHGGAAPPGNSFGVTIETSRGHRFGRAELEGLEKASRTVFLGACSGGRVSIAGLDERNTFITWLGPAGTASVVGPRWKIDADLALPVLDDTIALYVAGGSLIDALNQASRAAVDRGVPLWQAYSFMIEGAWQ